MTAFPFFSLFLFLPQVDLMDVLHVDRDAMTVRVEPLVSIQRLIQHLGRERERAHQSWN